jgi:hypothetical protein
MSSVSFFRKQLKIKGSSRHSDRGFFIMEYDCKDSQLPSLVEAMIARQGNHVRVERDGAETRVTHLRGTGSHYRTLQLNISSMWPLTVVM